MFSVITTESSITSPMAIAIAPSVMRLNVCPIRYIANALIASVSGIDEALIAVIRAWRRNNSRMMTARMAPMIIASLTDFIASRTNAP